MIASFTRIGAIVFPINWNPALNFRGAIVYQEPLGLIQLVAMVCCAAGLLLALNKPGQMGKSAA